MPFRLIPRLLVSLLLAAAAAPLHGASSSYYTQRLDDPKALYLERNDPGVHRDGLSDATPATQQFIGKWPEAAGKGIALVPAGCSHVSSTSMVRPGILLHRY